jgi:2-keto-3-deoxy-L-rhamnonate aldolase RhmA
MTPKTVLWWMTATVAFYSACAAAAAAATSLRQFLLQGGKSYGPLLLSDSPIVAEILASVGYGHVVIDHEHGPTNVRSGQTLLQAIEGASARQELSRLRSTAAAAAVTNLEPPYLHPLPPRATEAIVRLPGPNDPVYIKKVLDSMRLPGGILVPMVDDADTARAVVQATRYPTNGIRGCAVPFVRASAYGLLTPEAYQQQCRDHLLVMVQVETPKGVAAITDIAKVDGIDAIFLGPLDLSASIGKMGQFRDANFQALLAEAEQRVVESEHCLLAGFRVPGRPLSEMFENGYSLVCGSVDLGLFKAASIQDAALGMDSIAASTARDEM